MVEQVPATFPAMFAGYAVLWGCLALYIMWLGRRLSRLEKSVKATPTE